MTLREMQAILDYRLGRARWLFIHSPKNAGVSVRKAPELRHRIIGADPYFHVSRAYTRELARTMRERGEHHGFQHARLRDIAPGVRARLQPVAILRNPWARVVSRYRFAETAAAHGKSDAGYAAPSFEAFLEERHDYGHLPFYWHRAIRGWYPQLDYVTDEAGRIGADLLRMEHMDAEVPRYFGLAAPLAPRNVSVTAPGERPRLATDWKGYYTPRTIQIVADWYAADIDTFGFDFDSAATRNTTFAPG
jgi:hypothetical protein